MRGIFYLPMHLSFQSTEVIFSKSGIHNNKNIYSLDELDPRFPVEYEQELEDDNGEGMELTAL